MNDFEKKCYNLELKKNFMPRILKLFNIMG